MPGSDDVLSKGPKPTGGVIESIDLTGGLIPWSENGQPILLTMHGSVGLYLPVFRTEAHLQGFMNRVKVPYTRVTRIDSVSEFMLSVRPDVIVIQDPHFTREGRVRFQQVVTSR